MIKESKLISGLMELGTKRKQRIYFTDEEKHVIIQEVLYGDLTKNEVWKKYTGKKSDHGHILQWMRILGYCENEKPTFASNSIEMKKKDKLNLESESFETLQLKKRIEELEKQLKDAEMKAIAFSTMIDIAERNLNIQIRKKANTKPLKK
jgi:hypothetical protein